MRVLLCVSCLLVACSGGKNSGTKDSAEKESAKASREAALEAGAEQALFAGGCFWGVEHYMEKEPGVLAVTSGYTGGTVENPTYEQVTSGTTGHFETVEILYNPKITKFEKLARLFFEIHDPTQVDGQGPDLGSQYRSAVFYTNDEQRDITTKLIDVLKQRGFKVVTQVLRSTTFWPAEDYHQDYYARTGGTPYCHVYKKRF